MRLMLVAALCAGCSSVSVFEVPIPDDKPEPERYTVTAESIAPPSSHVVVVAECGEDAEVLAGGCWWGGYQDQLTPTHDHPEGTGWKCGAWNGDGELTGMVEAWAICEADAPTTPAPAPSTK